MTRISPANQSVYQDNPLDCLFIWLFSRQMAKVLGYRTRLKGYDGLVDLSKRIMAGRNAQQQQEAVTGILKSLIPAPVLWLIRTLFSPTRLVCELNAWFAAALFKWLVGPCQVTMVEVPGADGTLRQQASGVHIQKCRYLENSRCVGMCVNMCKLPTQKFFTQEFGIPLTMTPNFEDFSCEMAFGQTPPPLEQEASYHQPCLSTAIAPDSGAACPRVRDY